MDTDSRIIVVLTAASRRYARRDPAFLEQVGSLRHELTRSGVEVQDGERPGEKGLAEIEPVIQTLAVGGVGVATICGVVKLWLRQRGDRLIRMTVRGRDGADQVIELEGTNVSDETLLTFTEDVVKRLSDG